MITRKAHSAVLVDGALAPDASFLSVAGTGREAARISTTDDGRRVESRKGVDGAGGIAAGWEEYDSNAGGVGLAVINPIVE